ANIISEGDFVYDYLPYNQTVNLTGYVGASTNVIIPPLLGGYPVKIIDKYAFKGKNLVNVTIPEGVEKIAFEVFASNLLEEAIIPASVNDIGNMAFNANDLKIVSFKGDVPPKFGINVFDFNLHLVNICIPSTADEMAWKNALAGAGVNTNPMMLVNPTANLIKGRTGACAKIGTGEVTGPPALNCGTNAYQEKDVCVCFDQYEGDPYVMCSLKLELTCFEFKYQGWSKYNVITGFTCDNKSVRIPELIDGIHTGKINKDAFAYKDLTEVYLNDYLKEIDMYAFRFNKLRTITIPQNVNKLVLNAFSSNLLESVVFKGSTPPLMNNNVFTENPNLKKICVPAGTTAAYQTSLTGSGVPTDAVIYEDELQCKI
ncbi:MAG: leucine-rich repeat protein, partial [Bacilli bacterium]